MHGVANLRLGGDTGLGVGDLDTQGLGLGQDLNAFAGGDGAGDPTEHTRQLCSILCNGFGNSISSVLGILGTYSAA